MKIIWLLDYIPLVWLLSGAGAITARPVITCADSDGSLYPVTIAYDDPRYMPWTYTGE